MSRLSELAAASLDRSGFILKAEPKTLVDTVLAFVGLQRRVPVAPVDFALCEESVPKFTHVAAEEFSLLHRS